jgi:hypothetical protein
LDSRVVVESAEAAAAAVPATEADNAPGCPGNDSAPDAFGHLGEAAIDGEASIDGAVSDGAGDGGTAAASGI